MSLALLSPLSLVRIYSYHFGNAEISIINVLEQYIILTLTCLNNYKESEYLNRNI